MNRDRQRHARAATALFALLSLAACAGGAPRSLPYFVPPPAEQPHAEVTIVLQMPPFEEPVVKRVPSIHVGRQELVGSGEAVPGGFRISTRVAPGKREFTITVQDYQLQMQSFAMANGAMGSIWVETPTDDCAMLSNVDWQVGGRYLLHYAYLNESRCVLRCFLVNDRGSPPDEIPCASR